MRSKILVPAVSILCILVFMAYNHYRSRNVSLLLLNGNVYTLNAKNPVGQAIAVRGERIVAVGSTEEIASEFAAPKTIDLHGATVVPGLTDAHAHVEGLGALMLNLNLAETSSVEEIQKLVAEKAASVPQGFWIRGRSWDQNKWPDTSFPNHQMLDGPSQGHPVFLTRVDGHAVWVNQIALDIARVTKSTPDPEGGKILRDNEGNPTGIFIDNAIALIESTMPAPTEAERTQAVERAVQECLKVGLTEVHDMGADLEMIGIYKKLIRAGKFPFRVYVAINGIGDTWNYYLKNGPEADPSGRLTVRALKLYADGALGSRGAALIEPYSDDPLNRGLTLTPTDFMRQASVDALNHGFQVCTHAIGDRANHIVLTAYGDAFKTNTAKAGNARFRIEHAQVVEADEIPLFSKLGVIPSMQPTHCTSDMYWAEERLGPKRIKEAYAWRSFLKSGSIIPGGSDFPVESPNPLLGFYAAITRQDKNGWPAGGWYPEQKMARDEALRAFTQWAAYAAFEEDSRGTIEKGKFADLTVLSNDIMHCEPKLIIDTRVLYTIIAGSVAYSSENPLP